MRDVPSWYRRLVPWPSGLPTAPAALLARTERLAWLVAAAYVLVALTGHFVIERLATSLLAEATWHALVIVGPAAVALVVVLRAAATQSRWLAAAQAAQVAAQERDRRHYDTLPLPAYTWQRQGDDFTLIGGNPAAVVDGESRLEALFGTRASTLFSDRPDLLADLAQCVAEHRPVTRETPYRYRTTEEYRHLIFTNVFTPPDLVTVYAQDLTEQMRLQRQLLTLLESTTEGVYGLDLEGRCTWINQAGAALLGYAPAEVVGQPMHPLMHHSRPDGAPYSAEECPIYQAFRTGAPVRVDDAVLWRRDGTSFPAAYVSCPIVEDGRIAGAVVTFTDIGVRKQAEAFEQERARLEGALLVARTAAHELNNALSPITGFAELLTIHPLVVANPSLARLVQPLFDGSLALADKVRRLQGIARLEEASPDQGLAPHLPILDLDRSTSATAAAHRQGDRPTR